MCQCVSRVGEKFGDTFRICHLIRSVSWVTLNHKHEVGGTSQGKGGGRHLLMQGVYVALTKESKVGDSYQTDQYQGV